MRRVNIHACHIQTFQQPTKVVSLDGGYQIRLKAVATRLLCYSTVIEPVEKRLYNMMKNLSDITINACVNILCLMRVCNV